MARIIPSDYSGAGVANVSRGEDVLAQHWGTIVEDGHYLFARRGSRPRGVLFDPVFTTTSTTYTSTNATASGRDLDTIAVGSIPLRLFGGASSPTMQYDLAIYGRNVTVQGTMTRLDTGASSVAFTATCGTSYTWVTASYLMLVSTFLDVPLEFTFSAKWTSSGAGAELLQIQMHETIITAGSDLPIL